MHSMNIAGVDLNLLVVFEALYEERSVSVAASRVGLSQPAMSHALGRLRELLGDRLFVPSNRKMLPTPRAIEMSSGVTSGYEASAQRWEKEVTSHQPRVVACFTSG
jgi:DNA-binding transcriptional LysR family regulator